VSEGRIVVSLETSDVDGRRFAIVRVKDSGPGIAPDELENIFKPFYTTKERGTGLGIPAVSRIMRGHGGTCEAHSVEGHGATFSLMLPMD